MGGLFSRPAPQPLPPAPPTPPPPMPDPTSATALEAARKKAFASDSGRQSTMLSDAGGGLKTGGGDYSNTKLGG